MRNYTMHHVVAGWLGEHHRRIIQDFWNANIAAPKCRRLSVRAAARALGLAASTFAHELARGCEGRTFYDHVRHEWVYHPYSLDRAQEGANWAAAQKGPRSRFTRRLAARLAFLILDKKKSPYDALRTLADEGYEGVMPCVRTVYHHIAIGDFAVHYGQTPNHPRHARRGTGAHRAKVVPGRRTIDDRPPEAAFRLVRGHWELDTVVSGVGGSGGLLVLVERKTRRYRATRIARVSQECVLRAVRKLVRSGTLGPVLSVTTDNGCEFLGQGALDRAFGAEVYYTRACAAYEKGSVENANRLLRRWFPKGTDFGRVTPAEVEEVEDAVNSIHRRSLGGRTANQAFAEVA